MLNRMKLTRAELVAAQIAMESIWLTRRQPRIKDTAECLDEVPSALGAWNGEGEATLIWTPRGESGNPCQNKPQEIPWRGLRQHGSIEIQLLRCSAPLPPQAGRGSNWLSAVVSWYILACIAKTLVTMGVKCTRHAGRMSQGWETGAVSGNQFRVAPPAGAGASPLTSFFAASTSRPSSSASAGVRTLRPFTNRSCSSSCT